MNKQYFHYTPEIKIEEIINSGVINLATKSIFHKNEKPVAWVSTNLFWENTATKISYDIFGNIVRLSFEEHLNNFGCARIEVKEYGLMTWAKLKHKANMDLTAAKAFEETGLIQGSNSKEWYGSLQPIVLNRWIRAEVLKDNKWILIQEF
jgi:hypothetical protein